MEKPTESGVAIVSKHSAEITAAERAEVMHTVADLAADFAAIGKQCDAENRFPTELVARYKATDLPRLAVPRKYGGLGADIGTVSQVGRILAKGDPAIAFAFNMHQTLVGILRGTSAIDESVRAEIFSQVVDKRSLLCGPFSEARAGLTGLADTVAVPGADGGWRITGRKNWATLIEGADLIMLNATVTDADGSLPEDFREHAAREMTFVIAKESLGISLDYTWDTLGMRATGSQTLVLNGVYAGPSAMAGNFRQGLIGEAEWSAMNFGGIYLGVAERAYEETLQAVKQKHTGATLSGNDSAARSLGYVQFVLGRMRTEIEIAERAWEMTARFAVDGTFEDWPDAVRKARWDVAKVATTEAAVNVTDQGMRLVGGAAFRHGHVIERLLRDARAGNNHSFGTYQLYEYFARYDLGLLGSP
jgi:alkylation response protein AidB-like acyl-CoA dehydrogenase